MHAPAASTEAPKVMIPIAAIVLGVLELLGWLMAVGGMGRLHWACNSQFYDSLFYEYSNSECRNTFRDTWWALFLQLLVCVSLVAVSGARALDKARIPLTVFLGISTTYMMNWANVLLDLIHDLPDSNPGLNAWNSAVGGFITMTSVNCLLIIVVGIEGPIDLGFLTRIQLGLVTKAQPSPSDAPAKVNFPSPHPMDPAATMPYGANPVPTSYPQTHSVGAPVAPQYAPGAPPIP